MKWIRFCSAVVALVGLNGTANAGLFGNSDCCGAAKSCASASDCQPECCRPTISRPCHTNVHTYQRKCSELKPPTCDKCTAPKSCCAPAAKTCDAPAAKKCDAPAAKKCCAPAAKKCDAPAACGSECCEKRCCDADPCEIAKLIYESQTACYAKDRRSAIHDLGDDYDCVCNPEIMSAFMYALNDADERVRAKAADEIGDQLRDNGCCCSKELVAALTCALGDCDRSVRRQAEEALEACGYDVVDGCCESSCGSDGCGSKPAPAEKATPAPAPPEDPKAYFPSRLREKSVSQTKSRSRLAGLFGLLN